MPTLRFRQNLHAVILLALSLTASAEEARLLVQPERIELRGADREHGLLVTLVDAAGRKQDVTRRSKFTSTAPQVASVDARGQCRASADGEAQIEITHGGLTAKLPVVVSGSTQITAPSFRQDILPILTKAGCSAGGCHGKLAGQNGFRLSLRGYAPEWDHDWITKEVSGRRINIAFPEQSLLVQKPSGALAHEGGMLFREKSRYYETLIAWITARAPGPIPDEPEAARLEVLPGDRELRAGEKQQLLVRAHYADGRVRDVTWLAQFFSNDEATVAVKPDGAVKALREGETSVRVHFQGQVEVVRFTMPFSAEIAASEFTARQNAIDDAVFKKLQTLRIPPSPACDDRTFIRRAFLDTFGALPTPKEVMSFMADSRPDKRARLVDDLLARPEWLDYWALQLADLLQNRKERDHDVRGTKGVRSFHAWLRTQLAAGRGWDEIARSVLLAEGDNVARPEVGYFITVVGEKRNVEDSELPDSVAQSFLGTRIGCARCHNHPLEKYTQDDFYHFAAFFSKVGLRRENPTSGATVLSTVSKEEDEQRKRLEEAALKLAEAEQTAAAVGEEAGREAVMKELADRKRQKDEAAKRLAELQKKPAGVNQPRTGKFLPPQTLDQEKWSGDPASDPRTHFVEWMLKTENFSGAMVNRIWKHFFNVGLLEPVDDLRASNPPSHAELWALLNREFAASKFDLRSVMRLILNSRTYQLSSDTLPGNQTETRFYSHYYARRLPAEVLLDALSAATGTPGQFPGYPLGTRAVQLAEPQVSSYFLTLFGRSDRVTACACERKGEVTLPQLLHLRNGDEVQRQIDDGVGRLATLLKNPDNAQVTEAIFLATLSRPPTPEETNAMTKALAADGRDAVFKDLFWALLNSKEFAFNH